MKILSGYLSQTSGTALVDNKDIRKQLEEVKKFIGYLPETVPLYKEMTVREKIIAYLRSKERVFGTWKHIMERGSVDM